ncbi:MAG: DNA mismatch repair endonuclease MutL [Candidatus Lokiarchaeota archaeon]|nr:DNA mismatch repair endonuclease MutL [Candidatus Lokiarchaeota archaeon]MBD3202133.1 DNA mismatch repair endonuclease MutL [Candidatus Lokiarchaeota archaeon]
MAKSLMNRKEIKKIKDSEKIAAGEVIERPANVVKELIENSIDAEATEIRINLKKAGKQVIQVIDNGIGIPPDEISYAFNRHTSSKIQTIDDLNNLTTLGFRGEALASIAAVSRIEIVSRIPENKRGVKVVIEGGIVKETMEVSCPTGTNIIVKHLFYNIPARQKFLRTDATELGHITDIIQRYALAYPEKHFLYNHNELAMLNCPKENDLQTTAFHIYGKNIARNTEEISYSEQDYLFKVEGLIGHPKIAKKTNYNSSLFINKRYIKSNLLFRAIKEAYKGILMINRNPFCILNIEVDASIIDFNVHPKKLHIRFEDEEFVYNKLYNIIRGSIEEKFIHKEAKYISTELEPSSDSTDIVKPVLKPKRGKNKLENPETKIGPKKTAEKTEIIDLNTVQLDLEDTVSDTNRYSSETYIRDKFIVQKNFPKIKLISPTGQLSNKIYIILEGLNENEEQGFFILDQHAASERINKEKLLNVYENESVRTKQKLISPFKIELSPSEKAFIRQHKEEINKLGLEFEHFGGNTFVLRSVPTIFNKMIDPEIINEIIADLTEIGSEKSFSSVKEEIINYLSCHKSVRGGDKLSLKEIRTLLLELSNCEDPYHCAHGRPTLKFFSYRELDKLFKRTG